MVKYFAIYIVVCSVLGIVLIIVGLYGFLWGKSKELKLDGYRAEASDTET
jgi:hypothetical protein